MKQLKKKKKKKATGQSLKIFRNTIIWQNKRVHWVSFILLISLSGSPSQGSKEWAEDVFPVIFFLNEICVKACDI